MKISVKMAQWILTGLIGLFCLGNYAWADVILKLPENMTVVAVNGKNTKIKETVNLPDGVNQVVAHFQGLLARGRFDKNAEMDYSDIFVIKFKARTQTLKMVIPCIKRSLDLKKFNRESDIRILDSADNRIDRQIAKLEIEGFQIFRDYERELESFNNTDSPAALKMSLPVSQGSSALKSVSIPAATVTEKQTLSVSQQPSANMAEDMLKYWYQQADEATRARFRHWVNQ